MKNITSVLFSYALTCTSALAATQTVTSSQFHQVLDSAIASHGGISAVGYPSYLCATASESDTAITYAKTNDFRDEVMGVALCVFIPPGREMLVKVVHQYTDREVDRCYLYTAVEVDVLDVYSIVDMRTGVPRRTTIQDHAFWVMRTNTDSDECAGA
jgi:hypothetical protein